MLTELFLFYLKFTQTIRKAMNTYGKPQRGDVMIELMNDGRSAVGTTFLKHRPYKALENRFDNVTQTSLLRNSYKS
jgi:hypothetical protein